MVVDIGIVKNHIKPKADSTLRNMRKDDLIEYIRCLENNYNVAVSFNENQARYIESLGITEAVLCKDCRKGHPELAPNGGVWCALWNHVFRNDGFCSSGERRTE